MSELQISRRWRRTSTTVAGVAAGALLAAGCGFQAYDLPLPGTPVDPDHGFEITAEFVDVLNLVPRSSVKVNDVTVGEVTDVSRVGWHAKIKILLQDDVKLPDNAIADIQQTSLLGEKYVSLEAPLSEQPQGRLSDGDNLTLASTGRNPEVEEVLGALSFLLNGGGVGQLKTITHELNLVMSGRQERIGHLFGELDTLIGSLDDQKEEIIAAVDAVNDLAVTLNRERETVVEAIDTMGPALTVLADQHDQLIRMLSKLDELGVVGTRVIEGTRANLLASLRHLRPVLTQLNAAGQALPNSLDLLLSFPFPKEASEVIKGDYANTAIIFDASLTNLMGQVGGGGGGEEPPPLPDLPDLGDLCERSPLPSACKDLSPKQVKRLCKDLPPTAPLCKRPPGGGGGGGIPPPPIDPTNPLGGGGAGGIPGTGVSRGGGLLGGGLG